MDYIIGIVAVLIGGFLWERGKRKSAEAILTNVETKKEVQNIEADKQKNEASLQLEEDRRKMIEEKSDEEKTRDVIDSDILDFFNKPRK